MPAGNSSDLYDKVVRITNVYLGPAAERFIARQVESHLHKSPEKLSKADLNHLIAWIRLAVSLLTDDSEIVDEYVSQLEKLTEKKTR